MYIFIFMLDGFVEGRIEGLWRGGKERRKGERQRKECMKIESVKDRSCRAVDFRRESIINQITFLSNTSLTYADRGPSNVHSNAVICLISSAMPVAGFETNCTPQPSRQPETYILTSACTEKALKHTRSTRPALSGEGAWNPVHKSRNIAGVRAQTFQHNMNLA
jgi:hypothetical protein